MIYCIVMNQCRAPAALGAETFGEHFHDAVEFFAREISIRPGGADEFKESGFIPILAGRRRNCLLGKNVKRLLWD